MLFDTDIIKILVKILVMQNFIYFVLMSMLQVKTPKVYAVNAKKNLKTIQHPMSVRGLDRC